MVSYPWAYGKIVEADARIIPDLSRFSGTGYSIEVKRTARIHEERRKVKHSLSLLIEAC
jgi:hypothetical protein